MVQATGLRVWGFRDQGLGTRDQGSGIRHQGLGQRVSGSDVVSGYL